MRTQGFPSASRDELRPATHRQFFKTNYKDEGRLTNVLIGGGFLGPGESEYFDVGLTAGHNYRVYAQPEDQTVDFDLHIYDENGNLVAFDETTDADAFGVIQPSWTGPFRVVVNAARGASRYAVAIYE
jgi:hypothetical protein